MDPDGIPGCSRAGCEKIYSMEHNGAPTWNSRRRAFPFFGPTARKKGTGSELAGMLSFVIMFYTRGNFNVQRWEVMIRLELHMFFWQPGHRHLNSLLTAL